MEGVPTQVLGGGDPVVTLKDFAWYGWPHMTLRVEYDEPEPVYDHTSWPDFLGETYLDEVGLWPCPSPQSLPSHGLAMKAAVR